MSRFGSLAEQYFDNSGKPLAGGKIYFYEPGTTTDKTTYSDEALSVANTQPVVLDASGRQSDVFFAGQAKAVITDSDDVQIDVTDPVGVAPTEQFPTWDSSVSYSQDALIQGSDGALYRSLGDSNLNNNPTSTSGFWARYDGFQPYSASVTYNADDLVLSSGALYRCATDSTSGVTPVATNSAWDLLGVPPAGGAFTGSVTFEAEQAFSDFTITDGASVTIDPANGLLQTWILGDDRTPTISLGDNEWMLLRLQTSGGSWAITLPGATIVNGASLSIPSSGYLQVLVYKLSSDLYAADAGSVA